VHLQQQIAWGTLAQARVALAGKANHLALAHAFGNGDLQLLVLVGGDALFVEHGARRCSERTAPL
jgi:hypothetical protein